MEILAITQLLMKVGLTGLGILFAVKMRKERIKLATGELGNILSSGKDGIQLSKNHQLSKDASQAHISLYGPTRAGKSTNVIIPNLLQDYIRGSIITYDPAGEIYKITHKYQESIGRKVIVYNPMQPGPIEYNLLEQCRNVREVAQLSQALLFNGALSIELSTGKQAGGIEWIQLSQNLLTACLLYSKDRKQDIQYAIKLLIENEDDELESKFVGRAQEYFRAYKKGEVAGGMQASIKGTLTANLGLYLDDLAISKTSFNAEMLRAQECILYIQYPENMAYYLSPLMAPLYSQLIDQLIDVEGLPQWFVLDEFGNIGMLSHFGLTISTAAKRDICFLLCLQDYNQLIQVYGQHVAKTIWNNTKSKIILPGLSDDQLLKMLTPLLDEEEITIQQEKVKVRTKKPVLTAGEIRRIPKGQCLILSDNYQPILDDTNYYKDNPIYKERVK